MTAPSSESSSRMTPPGSGLLGGTRHSTVSMAVVRGLVEAVEQAGVARAEFLRAAGVQREELDLFEARLARSEVDRLCELALDLTGDPALALHWIENLSERVFVPVSHLIAHASSLRHALELLARFVHLLGDEAGYRISELDDEVSVRCLPFAGSPRSQRFTSEMIVAGFLRLVRCFSAQARPKHVSFAYAAPSYHAEYARIFLGNVRFDQPFTGIVFERAVLDAPSPQRDDDVREALQELAQRRSLRITHRTPYAVRVRDVLVRQGFRERADMETVARTLEISVRSLRRHLVAEGKSYNEIANEALAMVAKQLLLDPRRTIQEVAYELGFSEASTFHRAFKRWTEMTPSEYRQAQLASEARGS